VPTHEMGGLSVTASHLDLLGTTPRGYDSIIHVVMFDVHV
jgi:hypothetical protein